MNPDFDKSVAYHEAGHVVATFKAGIKVEMVRVQWNDTFGNWVGSTTSEPIEEIKPVFRIMNQLQKAPESNERSINPGDHFRIVFAGCISQALFLAREKGPNSTFSRDRVADLLEWMIGAETKPESHLCDFGDTTIELERRCFSGQDFKAFRKCCNMGFAVDIGDQLHKTITLVEDTWTSVCVVAEALIRQIHGDQKLEATLDNREVAELLR